MARGHTAAGGEEHGWRAFEVVIEQPNSRRAAGTSARFGRRGRLGRGGVALALAFACACATVWVVSDDGGGSSVEARVERAIDEQLGAAGLGYAHARGWSRAQALFLRDNSVGARSDFASRGDGGEAGAASEWARVEARQGAAGAHGGGAEGEWARFQDHHAAASSQLPQRGDTGAGSSAWGWVRGGGGGGAADRTSSRGGAGQSGLDPDAGLEISREAGPGEAARAELSEGGRSRGDGGRGGGSRLAGAKVETLWDFPEIRRMQVP